MLSAEAGTPARIQPAKTTGCRGLRATWGHPAPSAPAAAPILAASLMPRCSRSRRCGHVVSSGPVVDSPFPPEHLPFRHRVRSNRRYQRAKPTFWPHARRGRGRGRGGEERRARRGCLRSRRALTTRGAGGGLPLPRRGGRRRGVARAGTGMLRQPRVRERDRESP